MASLSSRTDAQNARRAEVERSVLAATEALLDEGASFSDLKIEQIATRAGISRTAFYFYFRDKRELLLQLTEEVSELLYGQAETWWSGDGDGEEDLREALGYVVGLYGEHASMLRAIVESAAYDEPVAEFWRGLLDRFAVRTRERIETEQAAGRAPPDLPAEATAFSLVWMTERTCFQWLAQGRDLADAELTAGLVSVWMRSVYGRLGP